MPRLLTYLKTYKRSPLLLREEWHGALASDDDDDDTPPIRVPAPQIDAETAEQTQVTTGWTRGTLHLDESQTWSLRRRRYVSRNRKKLSSSGPAPQIDAETTEQKLATRGWMLVLVLEYLCVCVTLGTLHQP